MTNQSCKRQKSSRQLSLWRRGRGQPEEDQNEQQPANAGSDNAEIARCLTPFSHPGCFILIAGRNMNENIGCLVSAYL